MALKNPSMFYLIGLFILLNVADTITTFFILPGESNPLFHLFGSIWPVLLLKAFVIWFVIRMYNRNIYPTNMSYYIIVSALLGSSIILGIAQYSNIRGMLNPVVLSQAAAMPVAQKVQSYFIFVGFAYIVPMFLSVLSFYFYDKSRNKINVDKKYYDNLPWWKQL